MGFIVSSANIAEELLNRRTRRIEKTRRSIVLERVFSLTSRRHLLLITLTLILPDLDSCVFHYYQSLCPVQNFFALTVCTPRIASRSLNQGQIVQAKQIRPLIAMMVDCRDSRFCRRCD